MSGLKYLSIINSILSVHVIGTPGGHFAERLHKHKLPSDPVLVSVLVSRSEVSTEVKVNVKYLEGVMLFVRQCSRSYIRKGSRSDMIQQIKDKC